MTLPQPPVSSFPRIVLDDIGRHRLANTAALSARFESKPASKAASVSGAVASFTVEDGQSPHLQTAASCFDLQSRAYGLS